MRSLVALPWLLLSLVFAPTLAAQQSAGDVETIPVSTGEDEAAAEDLPSVTYSTIGLKMVNADFDNVKSAVNLESTIIGLRVPTFPWIGLELNASFTMIPGQVDQPSNCGGVFGPPCPSNISAGDTFAAHMFGVSGVVRTPGTFFGVAKIGYRYLNTGLPELQDEGNGSTWTLGAGYRWNRDGFVEVGYNKIADRVDGFGVTFSYSYDR